LRSVDTVSYEQLSIPVHAEHDAHLLSEPLRLALGSTRTPLYPIFLRLSYALTPDYRWIPSLHVALLGLSTLFFGFACSALSGSRWFGFLMALPLAYPTIRGWVAMVVPEYLATALGVAAISSLLLLLKSRERHLGWVALVVTCAGSWLARPSLLFLVPLIPLLGVVLSRLVSRRSGRDLLGFAVALAVATVLPLMLYCSLRWVSVGQFGVVAFNGYNLVGIAASYLDEQTVDALPERSRPLARSIMESRRGRRWAPYDPQRGVARIARRYVANQWQIAEGEARRQLTVGEMRHLRHPDEPLNMAIDRELAFLSRNVLRLHPGYYLDWVAWSFGEGLRQSFRLEWLRRAAAFLLISLPVVWWLRRRSVRDPGTAEARSVSAIEGAALAVFLSGVGFWLASLATVAVVSWPMEERYLGVSVVLLPSALLAAIGGMWARPLGGIRWPPGGRRRWISWSTPAWVPTAALAAVALLWIGSGVRSWSAYWRTPASAAEWIWADAPPRRRDKPIAFDAQRSFDLTEKALDARMLVAAKSEYRVLLNSELVTLGSGSDGSALEAFDVTDLLRVGRNQVVVEARSSTGEGAFLLRLDVSMLRGGRRMLLTNDRWENRQGMRLRPGAPAVLPLPGRSRLRAGPLRPPLAILRRDVAPAARAQRMAPPPSAVAWARATSDLVQAPLTVSTFDFGEVVSGYLRVDFDGQGMSVGLLSASLDAPGAERPLPSAMIFKHRRHGGWADVTLRRCRYVTVVSEVPIESVEIDGISESESQALAITGRKAAGLPSEELEEAFRSYLLWSRIKRKDSG
jgi:hypothetical protein